jgi:1-acyl-sn-glycerol-3-phosphate acyltransferase
MSTLRGLLFGIWLWVAIFLFSLVLLLMRVIHRTWVMAGVRIWARVVLLGAWLICGVRVKVVGLENLPQDGGYLIASKHQSMLDTIAPFVFLKDPAFVLKKELLDLPFYGWVVGAMGNIPIDRAGGAAALTRMMAAARKALEMNRPIIIFPEGTRRPVGAEPDYKIGVAGLYRDLGAPCVPMALNTGQAWPSKGLPKRSGVVTLEILPAMPPGMPRAAFMRELVSRIEEASNRLAGLPTAPAAASQDPKPA